MKKLFRHGDLLIREINEIPDDLKVQETNILAEGEVTGHHHQFREGGVKIMTRELESLKKYLEVQKPAPLSHEEHQTIVIDPGKYEVINEREYDYFNEEMRQVID